MLVEKPPTLEEESTEAIQHWLATYRQHRIRNNASRQAVAPQADKKPFLEEEPPRADKKTVLGEDEEILQVRALAKPARVGNDRPQEQDQMYQWIAVDILDRWIRHELSMTRIAATAAAELSSDSDSDGGNEELIAAFEAIEIAESNARGRMMTDAGITAYILREFGPRDLLASWRYYKSLKMRHESDFSLFDAAAKYVQDFDAARVWCANFPVKKDKLAQTFLNGVLPLSLKEELSLSASRNYFTLSASFLCRYAE